MMLFILKYGPYKCPYLKTMAGQVRIWQTACLFINPKSLFECYMWWLTTTIKVAAKKTLKETLSVKPKD